MAEGLKPIGVSLVAENADQFVTATQAASKAEADLVASTQATAAATTELQTVSQKEYDAMLKMGMSVEYLSGVVKVETTEVQTNTVATAENSTAQAANAETVTRTAGAHQSNFTVMREGRLVMGVLIADMALMQLTAGQTNPQIQEMGKSLQTVVDTGLLAFIATGNPMIAVAAGIGAALLSIGQMATQADPDIVALNKDLDKMGAKDDAVQGLMKLTGATQDEATAALDFAKNHADAATELKGFTEQAQSSTPIVQGMADALAVIAQALGDIVKSIIPVTSGIKDFTKEVQVNFDAGIAWFKVLHDTGDMQQANATYSKFLADGLTQQEVATKNATAATLDLAKADEIEKQAKLDAKDAATQVSDLQKAVAADASKMLDLQAADQDKLAKAAQTMNDQIVKVAQARDDALNQIAFQRQQQEENNAQQVLQINQAMNDAIEKAGQALADKEANIQQQTNDKLATLYHEYETKVTTANDSLVKAHQTYADSISKIDQAEINDLANLDFTTKENLDKAKTQNDKEQVLERAAHEAEVIRQRVQTQKTAAEQTLEDSEKAANKQKADSLAVYEYQRGLEQQHAAQQIADAERTYAQQVEDAKKRDAEQLANLAFRMQQEEEALNRQAENARTRYTQQVADLRARLAQEVADTIAAEIEKAKAIAVEIQARMFNLGAIMQTAAAESALAARYAGSTAGVTSGTTGATLGATAGASIGAAEGIDRVFSSPATIQVAEGYRPERVTVQPLSNSSSSTHSIGQVTVNIQSNDPDAVWTIFQKKLAQEVWR